MAILFIRLTNLSEEFASIAIACDWEASVDGETSGKVEAVIKVYVVYLKFIAVVCRCQHN